MYSKQIVLLSFIDVMQSGINVMTFRRNCCSYTEYDEADGFSGMSVNVYRSSLHHSYSSQRLSNTPPHQNPQIMHLDEVRVISVSVKLYVL